MHKIRHDVFVKLMILSSLMRPQWMY